MNVYNRDKGMRKLHDCWLVATRGEGLDITFVNHQHIKVNYFCPFIIVSYLWRCNEANSKRWPMGCMMDDITGFRQRRTQFSHCLWLPLSQTDSLEWYDMAINNQKSSGKSSSLSKHYLSTTVMNVILHFFCHKENVLTWVTALSLVLSFGCTFLLICNYIKVQ